MRDLQMALDDLPRHYRLVVNLIDLEGLEYQEAAQALDLPIGTIKSRLLRARLLLRHKLYGHSPAHHPPQRPCQAGKTVFS
jgi:RNA polymerase sigma-70 factor, ECF subfamily